MLKNDDQSQYVYENTRNMDTMPGEKSDICVDLNMVLTENSSFVTNKMRKKGVENIVPALSSLKKRELSTKEGSDAQKIPELAAMYM